ncbi:hypothetical protein KDK_73520 [Dictyobacter kobayashii]|uniref:Uncharacterized protein n=1 Tax=Dictyobacter kobayashii TaxID=2014872 RepID=A0A402AWN8_9CHLR|nr:hypothetical protein KDK_73520 [Dictyobacter kobayashii]
MLDSLVDENSRGLGGDQVIFLFLCEVSLQSGGDTAGVGSVGDDAVGGPAARGFDRK